MIAELVKPVLVLVIGYGLRYLFKYLKVEIDVATFNAIVLSIVTTLLALIGQEAAVRAGLLG